MSTTLNFLIILCLIYHILNVRASDNDKNHTMSFEIRRYKTPTEQYLNHGHHLETIFKQFHKGGPRDNDSIALYRFLDDEFYGQIVIGHPGQTLYVNFDTSWDVSWVMSAQCSSIKAIGCWFHHLYDHSKSSEYKKDGRPFSLDIGNFNLTGFYSYDNISIAHSNVTAMSFIEMVQVPYSFIINRADGVMGLGLKTNSYDPFFYKLLNQKKIKDPVFSIYLNRDRQSNRGGNVMLGFIDKKHIHKVRVNGQIIYDNITYVDADPNFAYWQFNMDRIAINIDKTHQELVCQKGCKAIVDTSSNSIVGPQADVDQIHDIIKAREFFLHRYTVDCDTVNKLPKIDFILDNKNFTLSGEDYTVKMSYHSITLCLSSFVPANTPQEQDRWVLGAAFLAQFYSIYNVQEKKIGFVKSH